MGNKNFRNRKVKGVKKINSKERMLTALNKGIPDRVPATIHQWQDYHLKTFMDGMSDIEAFRSLKMDAAITYMPLITDYNVRGWAIYDIISNRNWRVSTKEYQDDEQTIIEHRIETPEGVLTYKTIQNKYTTFVAKHMIKNDDDIYLLEKYYPIPKLDKKALSNYYDKLGDDGIMRTLLIGNQGGCWQDICELYGTENAILATFDKPKWVHEFLGILLEFRLRFIYDNLKGAKVDLVETGGGASSSTVISPAIHKEFCLPYAKKIHDALHNIGHKVVYHTCGGMMGILDLIVENRCNASETLSPPGIGGNIVNPVLVKKKLGSKVALIGGLDQINILTNGTPEEIVKEVHRLFNTFGVGGGYIMSACDHFFSAPKENLIAYARAAEECIY